MKDMLINILEKFKFPIYLQGSMSEDENYPSSFFTFWNFETPETSHYDNAAHSAIWGFRVYFYSDDPSAVNTMLINVKNALKQNGWTIDGKGQDVASDEPSHTGRMLTCYYLENY